MSLIAGKILGIKISLNSKDFILEEIKKYLNNPHKHSILRLSKFIKPLVIVTPNPEQIVYATDHSHFASLLNKADVALPDGVGVVWAAKTLGVSRGDAHNKKGIVRIAGVEFMQDLVGLAAEERRRIGLIGGKAGLAVKSYECLSSRWPNLDGWAMDAPEVSVIHNELLIGHGGENDGDYLIELAEKIEKTNVSIVFVGLGAPKQEYFIEKLVSYGKYTHPVIFMSVGGSFDIISGKILRAPLLIRSIGFEWVWRLIQEPWRWKRQIAILRFMSAVASRR